MKIPRKTFTYISTKIYLKYYNRSNYLRTVERFFWERDTKMPVFMVNKAFWIHKGMHFRKKRIEYYHMSTPMGAFTLTRKPFTPPVKRVKNNTRRKRIGKIKYEQPGLYGTV